jgi:ribose transport system permease protein
MPFTNAHDTFFTQRNIQNVLRNTSLLAVFAIGETVVIIAGGIDLSLGSVIAFIGMAMAMLVTKLYGPLLDGPAIMLGISLALTLALSIGLLHATLIHKLRLPPFVVTLASLLLLRSQAMLMNKQLPITLEKQPAIGELANGTLFKDSALAIPIPVIILAGVAVGMSLLLNRCRIGRYVYSVGSNEQATELSGVNVYRVKMFAYGSSALLGGVAGILFAAYGGQGDPLAGQAYELEAVAAAVVGGANLTGGQGSVAGTILGSLLLYSIFSAINLTVSRPDLWRGTIVGGVLILAVLVTAFQNRRTA